MGTATIANAKQLARLFDHTLLKPDATQIMVEKLCDEALEYNFCTVCLNSSYIGLAARRLENSTVLPISVVGFPLGACTIASKVFETKQAIDAGAKEIDTVINLGALFSGSEIYVRKDITEVVKAAGSLPVKVIIETGFLNSGQIKQVSRWCVEAGARFVKTSTGFGPRGASVEDIRTIHATLAEMNQLDKVGIKASGGIKDLAFVKELVAVGATRIGASASVKIVREFSGAATSGATDGY